ncbi:MAG: SCP2 sterol-binding domain-containing protein [Gammaproteobacteria bacterium]
MPVNRLATLMLEQMCNGYLRLDAESRRYLMPLEGKVVHVHLLDLNWQSYWLFAADRIQILTEYPGTPDTFIKGTISNFLRAIHASMTNMSSFSGLEIQGNMEVAQQLQTLLRQIEIDWEEVLSHFTGDVLAHHVGDHVRQVLNWGRTTVSHFRQNMTEYLQEELRYFPSRAEVEDFYEDVTTLRHDVERLLARWQIYLGSK